MTRSTKAKHAWIPGYARLAALVLTALTLCAALSVRPARAAEWMTPYLEQVQEWGVMRGDINGNLHEDRNITRAEFVTLVNRAFGYTEVGPHTFTDVRPNDWYAEDISIAHQAGYFQGTSPNTASPGALVTREQAAVLLGRCLRFQGVTGAANSTFDDMQAIGGWSRPFVQEAADLGIIQGYSDGTFKPDLPITRGQMACFLVRALGTLVQEQGEQTSGGVYGNLTITVPGVKLKDTTITGNLYLTGGVGLGNVELENVNVLGKIIICGSGEAERGQHSIILRNVTASALDVDSLADQFLSIQAEGLTDIGTATIRTSAFIQDLTEDGLGLRNIRLEGQEGAQLQLAGNIKDVINLTPGSALQLAQGTANVITMDERAVDATLTIDDKAVIKELNLDAGVPVTGLGNIDHLNVNAAGSNVSMLPDTITVRPGITANINRQDMNNIAAAESSEDPRILAGYPLARNVAPTSAEAVFRTNKTGTIYWALTSLMDGSVGEEELMNPSNYSGKIIRSGTVNANASNTDIVARLTGLTREGSYYVSAMLVDARNRRSTVKVAAFTTPDDTAPNFATGYPQAPILTTDADGEQVAQIMVMPTKDCQMYYVLLPKGSTAPTAADFRSGALPGNLGFGVVTLRKNTPFLVSRINSSHLQEQTDYDLYLWLNDADNGKSSSVRKVTLRTKDLTPPTIQKLEVKDIAARSVTMTFALDEPGSLYWAVVREGANFYASGIDKNNPGQVGQIQIENGTGSNVLRRGGPVRAANGGTDYNFTISGLEPQTAYDLYYVAKDTSGNYCVYTQTLTPPMRINTLDGEPPTVTQEFENDASPEGQPNTTPYPNTDIRIVFSEAVLGYQTTNGQERDYSDDFLAAYQQLARATGDDREAAERDFADMLHRHIALYSQATRQEVEYRDANNEDSESWVLDFRKATVYIDSTTNEMIIAFPYNAVNASSAVNLASGETYYFMVSNIADNSDAHNIMRTNTRYGYQLPNFTTMFATVYITNNDNEETVTYVPEGATDSVTKAAKIFLLTPENTETVPEQTRWDMLIWTDTSLDYDLLIRAEGNRDWILLGGLKPNVTSGEVYNSLNGNFNAQLIATGLVGEVPGQGRPHLRQFTQNVEFAIVPAEDTVERPINMKVQIFAGSNTELSNVSIRQGSSATLEGRNITAIGDPNPFPIIVSPPAVAPEINVPYLGITRGSIAVTVQVSLEGRPGKVYYMAVPVEARNADGTPPSGTNYTILGVERPVRADTDREPTLEEIPTRLVQNENPEKMKLKNGSPDPRDVIQGYSSSTRVRTGQVQLNGEQWMTPNRPYNLNITGLDPETTYILYLASTDSNDNPSENAICYKFTTTESEPPRITIRPNGSTQTNIEVDKPSTLDYILVLSNQVQQSSNPFGVRFTAGNLATSLPANFNGTVLDAMLTDYYEGGVFKGSIFDNFATLTTKQTYAGIIREPTGTFVNPAPAMIESTTVTSQTGAFNLTGMQGTNYYTLIVVARAQNSDSEGFRASRTYYNVNAEYLHVLNCEVNPQLTTGSSTLYTGTLTITFSDSLHYRILDNNEERIVPLDSCLVDTSHTGSANLSPNGYKSIGSVMTPSGTTRLTDPAPTSANHDKSIGRVLTFTVSNASSGTRLVTFGRELCDSKGAVRIASSDATLQVTLRSRVVNGETQWYTEFTPAWERSY